MMAKKQKLIHKLYPQGGSRNDYPENYINWIDSIYVESKTLNKQLEFNELMIFINCLDDEMYEYNINTLSHYIDFAYQDEHYLFLSLIKNYNENELLKLLEREF